MEETIISDLKNIKSVYLDNNASTPILPEVKELMNIYIDKFANPSGIYKAAKENKMAVESARANVARLLNASSQNIVFTSCGSESNNHAIRGVVNGLKEKGKHLITSEIEHPSVLKTFQHMETLGFEVSYLKCNSDGIVKPDSLQKAIRKDTILVSIMLANNETGAIQPIKELCEISHNFGALFHSDAVQAIGKIPVDVKQLGVDMLSLSGHKLYAPKGIGVLYVKEGIELESLIIGGGQENGMRAGTENVIHIMAMGKAAELAENHIKNSQNIKYLKEKFEKRILEIIPKSRINSANIERLPNTINLTLPNLQGELFVLAMDKKGVSFSSASACKAGSKKPSYVLTAMGLSDEDAHCTIRISLGIQTKESEISYALEQMRGVVTNFNSMV
ncbi:MAG: cysteine desulfurase [Salinivirgaceae bacterium]|nr:cysteine desulfurase [Salinivirgaceae bacterium]